MMGRDGVKWKVDLSDRRSIDLHERIVWDNGFCVLPGGWAAGVPPSGGAAGGANGRTAPPTAAGTSPAAPPPPAPRAPTPKMNKKVILLAAGGAQAGPLVRPVPEAPGGRTIPPSGPGGDGRGN